MTTQADVDAAKTAWQTSLATYNATEAATATALAQSNTAANAANSLQTQMLTVTDAATKASLLAQYTTAKATADAAQLNYTSLANQATSQYQASQTASDTYETAYQAVYLTPDTTTYDSNGNVVSPIITADTSNLSLIDATSQPTIAAVSSGSGIGANATAIAAGDYAYGSLGNGTDGGLGNASLVDTSAVYPNTQKTVISTAQLNTADTNYTTAMNSLQVYITNGDTSSSDYDNAKQTALTAQYQWELARNNLQEVASTETGNTQDKLSDISTDNTTLGASSKLSDISTSNTSLVSTPTLSYDTTGLNSDTTLTAGTASTSSVPSSSVTGISAVDTDQRIRLSPMGAQNQSWMYQGICQVLKSTGGVVFPYTPTISYNHKADYQKMAPTHANTEYYVYTNTPAVQISLEAQFTAQNSTEAAYLLAAMHFFRTATKMHFGAAQTTASTYASTDDAGLSPPVLVLNGYGNMMFNQLACVLVDFSMALPPNVDYLSISVADPAATSSSGSGQTSAQAATAWVPAVTTFSLTLAVQQTPKQQREDFNFGLFASGAMMTNKKGGWI